MCKFVMNVTFSLFVYELLVKKIYAIKTCCLVCVINVLSITTSTATSAMVTVTMTRSTPAISPIISRNSSPCDMLPGPCEVLPGIVRKWFEGLQTHTHTHTHTHTKTHTRTHTHTQKHIHAHIYIILKHTQYSPCCCYYLYC